MTIALNSSVFYKIRAIALATTRSRHTAKAISQPTCVGQIELAAIIGVFAAGIWIPSGAPLAEAVINSAGLILDPFDISLRTEN